MRLPILRLPVLRLPVLRLPVLRLAILRLAILRLAILRLAILRLAVLRLAVLRLAVLRLAVLRLTVLRLTRLLCLGLCLGCSKQRFNRLRQIVGFLTKGVFRIRQCLLCFLSLLIVGTLLLRHPTVWHSSLSRLLLTLILIIRLGLLSSLSVRLRLLGRFIKLGFCSL